jgi:protein tyrosine phosphatase
MIWELKSDLIVTLANAVEGGREKGFAYWETGRGKRILKSYSEKKEGTLEAQVTDLSIECTDESRDEDLVTRTLVLSRKGVEHSFKMLHYTAWPDFGVSDKVGEIILESHRLLGDSKTPVIVHCSAGVGRTGVFIAADAIVRRNLEKGACLKSGEVFDVVEEMRKMRSSMVQVYRCLFLCGRLWISSSALKKL